MNSAGFTKASHDLYSFANHYSYLQEGPVSRRGPRSNDISKSHFSGHVKFCRVRPRPTTFPSCPWSAGASFSRVLSMPQQVSAHGTAWLRWKPHPPSHLEIGFGFGASFCWLEGALPLAHDEPHCSPASLLSVNEPLGPLEDRLEARGACHGVRTDRRQEKTADF